MTTHSQHTPSKGPALTAEARLQQARAIDMRLHGKLLFPEKSFPDEFFQPVVSYFSSMTDAPKSFLYCSALMTVSAVIGNRVSVQVGSQRLKVNVYLLMIAGSTVHRKTTGINFTRKPLRCLEERLMENADAQSIEAFAHIPDDGAEPVKFLMPDSGSLEGLIEAMREPGVITVTQRDGKEKIQHQEPEQKTVRNCGLALYSEFAGLQDMMSQKYNDGYKTFLVDSYDGNDYERQLKREKSFIKNPCLSLFAATTMAQLTQRMSSDDKYSGFFQRFAFCHETEQQRALQSLIEISTPDEKSEELVLSKLERIYRMSCFIHTADQPFGISDDAKRVYQSEFDFDQSVIAEVATTDKEFAGVLQGYFGRLDAMRFKIALVFQVVKDTDQNKTGKVITGDSMQRACDVVAFFQGSVIRLLRDEFRFTPFEQKTKRITDILVKNKGVSTKRDLSRSTKFPVKELDEVLDSGVLSGLWTVNVQTTLAGRPTTEVHLCKTRGDT